MAGIGVTTAAGTCAAAVECALEKRSGISWSIETFFCGVAVRNSAMNRGVTTFSGRSSIVSSFAEAGAATAGLIQERSSFQLNASFPCLIASSTAPNGRATSDANKFAFTISCRTSSGQDCDKSDSDTVKNLVSAKGTGCAAGTGAGVTAATGGLVSAETAASAGAGAAAGAAAAGTTARKMGVAGAGAAAGGGRGVATAAAGLKSRNELGIGMATGWLGGNGSMARATGAT